MSAAWGLWTTRMDHVVRPRVVGQTVWDLGAGSLVRARQILALGADHVVAVDKRSISAQFRRVTTVESYFYRLDVPPDGIRVAFVGWPVNVYVNGLADVVRCCDVVVYLGSNTGGNACGTPSLWNDLCQRTVLAHVPHRRNSLIVYGAPCGRRPLLPEEVGATCGNMVSFTEAEEIAARVEAACAG